jgi:hypothetical protein
MDRADAAPKDVNVSGITDETRGLDSVMVKLDRRTLERLDRLARRGRHNLGDPSAEELVQRALSAYIETWEQEK